MKEDRRQRKTKAAVQKAVIELSAEREISDISVTDLAERADINRSTFYLHYRDVHDVLAEMEREIVDGITALFAKCDLSQLADNIYPVLKTVCDELEQKPSLKKFFAREGGQGVYYKIQNSLAARLTDLLTERYPALESQTTQNTVLFVTSGVFGVFAEWSQLVKRPPLDELAVSLQALISASLKTLILTNSEN